MTQPVVSPFGKDSLDIEAIKTSLIETIKSTSDHFNDVDFKASNISLLLDTLAYSVFSINNTSSMLFNETQISTATKRNNIIQLAKNLGYHLTRVISAKQRIVLKPKNEIPSGASLILPRFHRFLVNDVVFYNDSDLVFTSNDNNGKEVKIKEGIIIDKTIDEHLAFTIDRDTIQIRLPYRDIEEDSIEVYVKKAGESTFLKFDRIHSLLDFEDPKPSPNKNVYFEDFDTDSGFVILRFWFANTGTVLKDGDEVEIRFALSIGSDGNNLIDTSITTNDLFDNLGNPNSLEIEQVIDKSYGGASEESNYSIQTNAPRFYNSANRCVTEDDYEAHLEMNSLVDKASAWGGETMPQIFKGRIYFSVIPQDKTQLFIDQTGITKLLDQLAKKRIVSTERVYWHPLYFMIAAKIKILGSLLNIQEKEEKIRELFTESYNTNFRSFKANIYYAKLVRDIEAVFAEDRQASVEVKLDSKIRVHSANFEEGLFIDDEEQCHEFSKDFIIKPHVIDITEDNQTAFPLILSGSDEAQIASVRLNTGQSLSRNYVYNKEENTLYIVGADDKIKSGGYIVVEEGLKKPIILYVEEEGQQRFQLLEPFKLEEISQLSSSQGQSFLKSQIKLEDNGTVLFIQNVEDAAKLKVGQWLEVTFTNEQQTVVDVMEDGQTEFVLPDPKGIRIITNVQASTGQSLMKQYGVIGNSLTVNPSIPLKKGDYVIVGTQRNEYKGNLIVTLPVIPSEFFLVKNGEKIPANGKDIKTYLLNGWELIKSIESIDGMEITGDGITVVDHGTITLPNGVEIKLDSEIYHESIGQIGTINWNSAEMSLSPEFWLNYIQKLSNNPEEQFFDFHLKFKNCNTPLSLQLRRNLFPIIDTIAFE